jgi:hypothetical protein
MFQSFHGIWGALKLSLLVTVVSSLWSQWWDFWFLIQNMDAGFFHSSWWLDQGLGWLLSTICLRYVNVHLILSFSKEVSRHHKFAPNWTKTQHFSSNVSITPRNCSKSWLLQNCMFPSLSYQAFSQRTVTIVFSFTVLGTLFLSFSWQSVGYMGRWARHWMLIKLTYTWTLSVSGAAWAAL